MKVPIEQRCQDRVGECVADQAVDLIEPVAQDSHADPDRERGQSEWEQEVTDYPRRVAPQRRGEEKYHAQSGCRAKPPDLLAPLPARTAVAQHLRDDRHNAQHETRQEPGVEERREPPARVIEPDQIPRAIDRCSQS
jgi:hypothetical protein